MNVLKTAKKNLVTFFTLILLVVYSGGAAFAAETDSILQNEATANDTIATDDKDPVNDANVFINDQGQVYDNGKLVDEQGEVISPDEKSNTTDDTDTTDDTSYTDDTNTKDDTDVSNVKDNNTSKSSDKDKKDSKAKDTDKTKNKDNEKPSYAEKDLRLLSALVYSEAGGQPYVGQLGVANVVLNRLKSDAFSYLHNIKEAIYDNKWGPQFAVTVRYDKSSLSAIERALKCYDSDQKQMQIAIKAAKSALEGENNIGSLLCFQNKRYANSIKKKYPDYKVIGNHVFYRSK